ncbi:WYL domain-containing protein [Agromyces sp. SYSU K20354]|uniref:helix-turn-helix transcriptional regulator n=1 Tax=Agromyces cavernae TaxID=2898659 RepID=UPI001E2AA70B|nr:WYL domain-containing protein [Agromyces cavernae]MCD2443268.1 WYL domain-containing protein [Agromyces cavernae]
MRADRLVATLLLMQARGRVTARQLADELEISVATARRDLEALSAAGVPVYPQSGRGGGWSLLGDGRTDLSGFTASEARALFLLLGPRAGESTSAASALRKVMRALPPTFRADAEAAADAVVVEAGGWGAPASTPAAVHAFQHAVVERRLVGFTYAAWGRQPADRVVRPLGLVDKAGRWYLVADTDRGLRSYRVDRMTDVETRDDRFEPPAGFDLDAAWASLSAEIEQTRVRTTATVLVDPAVEDEFRGWVGQAEVLGAAVDGRVIVRVAGQTELVLARRLAAWGAQAEVVEPPAVRRLLAGLGAALAAQYGGAETSSGATTSSGAEDSGHGYASDDA